MREDGPRLRSEAASPPSTGPAAPQAPQPGAMVAARAAALRTETQGGEPRGDEAARPRPPEEEPAPTTTGSAAPRAAAGPTPPAAAVPAAAVLAARELDRRADPARTEDAAFGESAGLPAETRVSDGAPKGATAHPAPHVAELPRPAILQVVEALRSGEASLDLTLSPEELGRVKLSLGTHDGVLTVIVQADRPETADLMRRSIDLLLAEAREAGFEDVAFGFGSSGGGDTGQRRGGADPFADTAFPGDAPRVPRFTPPARPQGGGAGLDLRL